MREKDAADQGESVRKNHADDANQQPAQGGNEDPVDATAIHSFFASPLILASGNVAKSGRWELTY